MHRCLSLDALPNRQVHGTSSPIPRCCQAQHKLTPTFFPIRSYTMPIHTLIDCMPSAIRQVVGLLSIQSPPTSSSPTAAICQKAGRWHANPSTQSTSSLLNQTSRLLTKLLAHQPIHTPYTLMPFTRAVFLNLCSAESWCFA
jgi:hypothetical protein